MYLLYVFKASGFAAIVKRGFYTMSIQTQYKLNEVHALRSFWHQVFIVNYKKGHDATVNNYVILV